MREEATAFSAAVRRALRAFLCSGRAGVAAVFLALHPCVCRLRPGTGGRHFFGGKGRSGVPFFADGAEGFTFSAGCGIVNREYSSAAK